MESHLVQQQKGLHVKIPDISNALQALHHLMKKDDVVSCHFELADSVYANAKIQKENTVLLWLGANVMLEYTYAEADALLTKNLSNAEVTLKSLDEDLAFLKDQITISEVNIARIHNYNVQLKKDAKEKEAATSGQPQISKQGKMQAAGTMPM
jgi:prefoldin subunit 5